MAMASPAGKRCTSCVVHDATLVTSVETVLTIDSNAPNDRYVNNDWQVRHLAAHVLADRFSSFTDVIAVVREKPIDWRLYECLPSRLRSAFW